MDAQEFRSFSSADDASTLKSDPERGLFAARIVSYGPVDSHGTSWAPGVFAESLRTKLPVAVWSHDWHRPIGKVVEYRDSAEGLDVVVQMADGADVPDARMARSLLKDRIIDQYSFGFLRQADEPDPTNPGAVRITKARIDEISPVLVASGKGTGTLAVRSHITRDAADTLIQRVASGELDAAEALRLLGTQRAEAPTGIEVRSTDPADLSVLRESFEQRRMVLTDLTDDTGTVVGFRAVPSAEPVLDTEVDAELRSLEDLIGEEFD
jgi:HK97 family phage prohead protease